LRRRPSDDAPQDSELLLGEMVTVYERKDGWAWVQAESDSYVGYLKEECLSPAFPVELQISALMTPVFSRPDLKSPLRDMLPMTAGVNLLAREGDYLQIAPVAFVHRFHVALPAEVQPDFVAVAERFLGVPYLWGGKSHLGIDCSGLVQVSLNAAGTACLRDSDMQQASLGEPLPAAEWSRLRRGDLLFWKGHVAIARDADSIVHANAHHMATVIEDARDAIARIKAAGSELVAIRRIQPVQE